MGLLLFTLAFLSKARANDWIDTLQRLQPTGDRLLWCFSGSPPLHALSTFRISAWQDVAFSFESDALIQEDDIRWDDCYAQRKVAHTGPFVQSGKNLTSYCPSTDWSTNDGNQTGCFFFFSIFLFMFWGWQKEWEKTLAWVEAALSNPRRGKISHYQEDAADNDSWAPIGMQPLTRKPHWSTDLC
jgi:hypothetical protein